MNLSRTHFWLTIVCDGLIHDAHGTRYEDTRQSMPGTLTLSVGGGQPDYYTGALSATVTVAGAAIPLTQCA